MQQNENVDEILPKLQNLVSCSNFWCYHECMKMAKAMFTCSNAPLGLGADICVARVHKNGQLE